MLAKTGNMADVYREYWALMDLVEDAERRVADNHVTPSLNAEIDERAAGAWYLVQAFPGDDLRAMRWLARRRFGVFRPMRQRTWKRNEAVLLQGWEPVFAGWLFVFAWGIGKMHARICACPGVRGILCDPATLAPVAIPDDFVQRIRAYSWVYDDRAAHTHSRAHVQGRRRRPRKSNRINRRRDPALTESAP